MANLLAELNQQQAPSQSVNLLTELQQVSPEQAQREKIRALEARFAKGIPASASEALRTFQSAPKGSDAFAEPLATAVTGIAAEPVAGIAGIGAALIPGGRTGAEAVKGVRQALTFQPKTEEGKAGLKKLGEFVEPVAKGIKTTEQFLGDIGFNIAGPVGGAVGATIPTAILEGLGAIGLLKPRGTRNITGISDEVADGLDSQGINIDDFPDDQIAQLQTQSVNEARRKFQIPEAEKFKSPFEKRKSLALEIDKGNAGRISQEANPDPAILAAAEELGVEIIPSTASRNLVFREIEQGLKSVPGSLLKAKEAEGISQLAQKADDLITEFGGTTDKAALGARFERQSKNTIKAMEVEANQIYKQVRKLVPAKTLIEASATLSFIKKRADEFGGAEELTKLEGDLLGRLSAESAPTYARLDELRKRVGKAKRGQGDEIFKSADKGLLKKLESLMLEDQRASIQGIKAEGATELFDAGRNVVAQRKILEADMKELFGTKMQKDFLPQVGRALVGLSKGNIKNFEKLIDRVPSDLKQEVILTAMNDVFRLGSRKEKQLSLPGFVDWYNGIARNSRAIELVNKNLPRGAARRLEKIATLAQGIRRAQESEIKTGRILAVPELFDTLESKMGKIFGVASKAVAAEIPGSALGLPGVASASILTRALTKGSTPKSKTADALLASPLFKRTLEAAATRGPQAAKATADKLENTKAFKSWLRTLPAKETASIAAIGFVPWLNTLEGQEQATQQQTTQQQ